MKEVNKIALKLPVPQTCFDTWESLTLEYLENFHEYNLKKVGLTGYTGELGNKSNYRDNFVNTQPTNADSYYLPYNDYLANTPMKEIIGLDDNNYFKTIYQVCVLLRQNWDILSKYHYISVGGSETHMLFPFKNYLNQKCLGGIGRYEGFPTFRNTLNLEKSKYKDSSIEFYGHSQCGLMVILPNDNKGNFLESNSFEVSKDYKLLSLEDFKKELFIISETTETNVGARYERNDKIEERIRVELSYSEDGLWPYQPVKFIHPEGSFIFDFNAK